MEDPVMASTEVNNNQEEEGKKVAVEKRTVITVTEPEQWLCVAKLPLDTTEAELLHLLTEFGQVTESFLMVSEKNGHCKGYGFARFDSPSAALQARHVLEGQEVRGHRVDCEWVKEGTHTLASLHSKVLYVDHLPPAFRDLPQFRKLFATVVSPPYCQIAQKHGVLQKWGLVEFDTAEQAEATMEALKGATLDGQPVRVQYCVPNIHAINIYMSFVNNPLDNRSERKALLDEGPSKDVYHQLEQLSKQNPVFVQSLQSIMTASHREDPGLAQQAAPTSPALLALLLASQIQPGSASLAGLAKKLESGTSVVELLQQALAQSPQTPVPAGQSKTTSAPAEPRPPLLPSPPAERSHILPGGTSDLAGLISRMTSTVAPQTPVVTPNTKSPQLQNMLYSAFQARISQQGEPEAPLPTSSTPKEDPPPQAQPPQSVASYPVNLQTTYSVVAAPSYYQSPPPNHLQHQQPSNLTHMLSQPPPPPPPSHNQHLASDHSWAAQAPLLVHAPLMAHPQALWAAQPALYHAQHAPQQQAASSQKRKVDVEYPNYSDLEAPGLKRQKLCGN